MEYLPGQYDQRADSAAQCVQLLTQGERPRVLTARVICLKGELSPADVERIQQYLVNPVESRLASLDKPETLDMTSARPADVARVAGFISMKAEEVEAYWKSMGFAMSPEDLLFCQRYFRDEERRDPTVTELRVIDTYWSDHCRHTTFLTRLESIEVEPGALSGAIETALQAYMEARREVYGGRIGQKNVSLMDMATMGMRMLKKAGPDPGSRRVGGNQRLLHRGAGFHHPAGRETAPNNGWCSLKTKPTTTPPRSSLSAARPPAWAAPSETPVRAGLCVPGHAGHRQRGSAGLWKNTLPGKLPTRKITTGAAAGYSSYGNQIGLATGQVAEIYDPGYVAKRLEIGAVVGASPKENVVRVSRRQETSWCCWAAVPGGTAAAAPPAPPKPIPPSPSTPAARRCKRAIRPPSGKFSGCSGIRRFPDDQTLQRLRRRRRLRGDRRTGPRPAHRAGPGSQKIRGPGRHRAGYLRIPGTDGGRAGRPMSPPSAPAAKKRI